MRFSVWAPLAREVTLELDGRSHPMERANTGWWSTDQPALSGRSRYAFAVDGAQPRPDPRARWQPDGVHAASRFWDTESFARRKREAFTPRPLSEAVFYEMHVGTFTLEGTYAAARGKLAHLRDLGITHLELLPLATFPGERGWGYDGVYPYAPHPAYGTPGDLVALIDACHEHGLAVILDVVYNHLGPDGNYLAHYGPYFTAHWKTPWGDAINFDGPESDHVRAFVIDNALMWLGDYGFDGLRLDAVHAIIDSRAHHVLEELAERVRDFGRATGRDLLLVAESDRNDPRYVRPPELGGYGLHAHWADDFHHAVHAFFTRETDGYYADFGSLRDVATAMQQGYVYTGQYSRFRRRGHGRRPEGVRSEQLVVAAQNHDQIGNRALGERLSMLLPSEKLKAIAALVLLSPRTPLLFQGEEWGARTPFLFFTDHLDPELGRAVTEGRRKEFAAFRWDHDEIPDPQLRSTFERSKLDWAELETAEHRDLLDWHRRLLALRREYVVARREECDVQMDEAAGWLTVRCARLLAVFNLRDHPQRVPVPTGKWTRVLGSADVRSPADNMPPGETCIWRAANL